MRTALTLCNGDRRNEKAISLVPLECSQDKQDRLPDRDRIAQKDPDGSF
jgi:hypothetical protein